MDDESIASTNEDSMASASEESSATQRPSRRCKTLAMKGLIGNKKKQNEAETMEHEVEDDEAVIDEDEEDEDEGASKKKGKKRVNETGKRGRKPGAKSSKTPVKRQAIEAYRRPENVSLQGTLFDVVKQAKIPLTTVVDEWIESYKQDRDQALLTLIQFLIHACGCKGTVTMHMYTSLEHADIIRKMTEQFDEDSADYPIIMAGAACKKFRNNLCELIACLVRQCQYSIIYDQYMMDNMISLITGLTDSQVRAFRHTSTLCAMKLMTALVDVSLNLSISLDHTQRQYEGERAKVKAKQAQDRLELLLEKRKETEENQEEIRHMLTYIFKGVFVHRYRDVRPEIRVICTQEVGVWMKRYPTMFLDDSYLKYIGWTLYDRVGEVRLCCLKCLQPLYEAPELLSKLELFTNRFKDRIVEMTLDKELEVSVHAVKLVISIFKWNESILGDKDCESIYELVYSSHRPLANAAGQFLAAKLFSNNNHQEDGSKKKVEDNTPYMRDLVFFFIESELHEHGAYLVDSLWDSCSMLKDWGCYTSLLLDEPANEEDALDDKQETSLIELMVCAVKQAATGGYPVGRGPSSRKMAGKELKHVAEDKSILTEHFIPTLPLLLDKFAMHAEKIGNLLNLPLHFDLHIYTTGRHEKHLELLLKHLESIMEKYKEYDVLLNCSRVLEHLCSSEFVVASKCNIFKMTLVDNIFASFNVASNAFFDKGGQPSEDETYALIKSLDRIHAILNCHDLVQWDMSDFFHKLFKEKRSVNKDILCKGIACYHLYIYWRLATLDSNNATEEQLKHLRKKLKSLMESLCMLLKHPQVLVQEEAYITICDLLILFNKHLATNHPHLSSLIFQPDSLMQDLLCAFLEERVFVEDDEDGDENDKIEGLHKRRSMLASFCKLVMYNVMKIKKAADVFKYYIKFYNDFGDIIKHTMAKAREINNVQTAKTLALSLTQLFTSVQAEYEDGKVPMDSEGFAAIKDLARRFSQSFGLDPRKIRNAIAAVHNDGIFFVVHSSKDADDVPLNINFLDILTEFSVKLMKEDKRVVLEHLESHLQDNSGSIHKNDAFNNYKLSLSNKDYIDIHPAKKSNKKAGRLKRKLSTASDESEPAVATETTPPEVRKSTRNKKSRVDEDEEEGDAGDDDDRGGVDNDEKLEEGNAEIQESLVPPSQPTSDNKRNKLLRSDKFGEKISTMKAEMIDERSEDEVSSGGTLVEEDEEEEEVSKKDSVKEEKEVFRIDIDTVKEEEKGISSEGLEGIKKEEKENILDTTSKASKKKDTDKKETGEESIISTSDITISKEGYEDTEDEIEENDSENVVYGTPIKTAKRSSISALIGLNASLFPSMGRFEYKSRDLQRLRKPKLLDAKGGNDFKNVATLKEDAVGQSTALSSSGDNPWKEKRRRLLKQKDTVSLLREQEEDEEDDVFM